VKRNVEIVIVGAGFGGLAMAIRLQQAGRRDFLILEKAAGLGGTWHDNTYPGCACDIPSHLYSLSFDQHPGWSRHYASQPEILGYLEQVADRHGLREKISFNTQVKSLGWDDVTHRWQIETGAGDHGPGGDPRCWWASHPAISGDTGIEAVYRSRLSLRSLEA
jgi:cation diffusion facilitator CzcD-associated flavoprotein CzcO